jgi:Gas vesicle synthesis protein GvpL/GvpF
VIDLYAITAAAGPPLPTAVALHAVPLGDLAAICAPAEEERDITADTLWRHEQVVEALMEDRDLLPVRFGTRLDDDDAAARSLAGRRAEFKRALERVRGAVELSVRAVFLDTAERVEPTAETGADYLRLKRRITAAQETVANSVHEPLRALARAHVLRSPRAPAEALRAAYLVERGAVGRFSGLVAQLDEQQPELQLLCTGPWPPYSFVES